MNVRSVAAAIVLVAAPALGQSGSGTGSHQGDEGIFYAPAAFVRSEGDWSVVLSRDHLNLNPKDLDVSTLTTAVSRGFACRLELFGTIGWESTRAHNLGAAIGEPAAYPFVSKTRHDRLADPVVGAKYEFLRAFTYSLAVRTALKLPLGEQVGLGSRRYSLTAQVVASRRFGLDGSLTATVGGGLHSSPETGDKRNALLWAVGASTPSFGRLQVQAEVRGAVQGRGARVPVDLTLGPALWLSPTIFIRPAYSVNLAFDEPGGAPSLGAASAFHVAIGVVHLSPPRTETRRRGCGR